MTNPLKSQPNFSAAPAKGILKKASSNPQLTKLEEDEFVQGPHGMSEFAMQTKRLSNFQPNVVDIKKYLKSQQQQQVFLKFL